MLTANSLDSGSTLKWDAWLIWVNRSCKIGQYILSHRTHVHRVNRICRYPAYRQPKVFHSITAKILDVALPFNSIVSFLFIHSIIHPPVMFHPFHSLEQAKTL